ncbi:ribokinase [Acinetobacter boissieri]|uniref:Ribokinase n=1 Tax=Acinetobacter boissieri TaxID=1219383 RepID=A0A1G6H5E0_9GAMM|nr:ribokinase [Acinetobacter boissieri]SDB88686.1 ribokinase [Acinetobacter boissieri]
MNTYLKKKLVVLGSINADHILRLEQFPHPGQTLHGQSYQVAFGGKGANQAVAAGRSGANTHFIACVGEDAIGTSIKAQLNQDQVNTQAVISVPGETTGVALIFVNALAENCIGICSGANAKLSPEYVQEQKNLITSADALLVQLETPIDSIIEACKIAQQANVKVILNPAPARELPEDLLKLVDIITPNETEALSLTGKIIHNESDAAEAAAILHSKGIKTVVITLGSRGVWLSENNQGSLISGFKVNAIDTIAAGDTFNGAFITALLENQTPVEAARFANAAAAIAVTRQGAQPSVPWRTEIDAFLVKHT